MYLQFVPFWLIAISTCQWAPCTQAGVRTYVWKVVDITSSGTYVFGLFMHGNDGQNMYTYVYMDLAFTWNTLAEYYTLHNVIYFCQSKVYPYTYMYAMLVIERNCMDLMHMSFK